MKVICPHCGNHIAVNGLGRKPLNIPLKNVLESLQVFCNVKAAAEELGCSQSYIFGVLKNNNFRLKELIKKGR
jgi:hypothetical protein